MDSIEPQESRRDSNVRTPEFCQNVRAWILHALLVAYRTLL